MPNYTVTAPDGKQYNVTAPEGATQEEIIQRTAMEAGYGNVFGDRRTSPEEFENLIQAIPIERSPFRALTRGVSRGASRLGSMVTDVLPALGASALGFDEYAQEQLQEAQAKEAELQRTNRPEFSSFKEVSGVGDAVNFVAETIGEQAGNIVASLIGGGVAGMYAKRLVNKAGKELVEDYSKRQLSKEVLPPREEIAQQLKDKIAKFETRTAPIFAKEAAKQSARGQVAGAGAVGVGLNTTEIFQNIYEETGELAPVEGVLFGSVAGALDTILPARLLKRFRGLDDTAKKAVVADVAEKKGLLRGVGRLGAGTLKASALEGLTEGAQEAISISAEQFVDEAENFWGSEEFDRILEAAVRGAVAGGPFGTVDTGAKMLQEGAVRREEINRKELAEQERVAREAEIQQEQESLLKEEDELTNQLPALKTSLSEQLDTLNAQLAADPDDKVVKFDIDEINKKLKATNDRTTYLENKKNARQESDPDKRATALQQIEEDYAKIKKAAEQGKAPSTSATAVLTPNSVFEAAGIRKNKSSWANEPFTIDRATTTLAKLNETSPKDRSQAEKINNQRKVLGEFIDQKKTEVEAALTPEVLAGFNDYVSQNKVDITNEKSLANSWGAFNKDIPWGDAGEIVTNAVQKQSPASVDVSEQTRNGEEMGERDAEEQAITPTKTPQEEINVDPGFLEGTSIDPIPEEQPDVVTTTEVDPGFLEGTSIDPISEEQPDVVTTTEEEGAGPIITSSVKPKKPDSIGAYQQMDRDLALRSLAADMATSSIFDSASVSQYSEGRRIDENVAQNFQEATVNTQEDAKAQKLREKTQRAIDFINDENYGSLRKHFGKQGENLPLTGGTYGKNFWDTLTPEEKQKVKEYVKGYAFGTRTQKEYKAAGLSSGAAPVSPTTVDRINSEVSRVFKDTKLGEALVVAPTPEAAGIADKLPKTKNNEVVRGAVVDGKAYLFSDNIEQGEEIAILLHEVGSHLGMKKMVGAANYASLVGKIKGWANSTTDNVESKVAKIAAKKAGNDNDELLAYFIEEAVKNGVDPIDSKSMSTSLAEFFKKIISALKQAISKLNVSVDDLTAADVVHLAYGAAQLELSNKQLDMATKTARQIEMSTNIPSNANRIAEFVTDAANQVVQAAPSFAQKPLAEVIGKLSNAPGAVRAGLIKLTSLDQLGKIAGSFNPKLEAAIDRIYGAVSARNKLVSDYRNEYETLSLELRDTLNKYPRKQDSFNNVVAESTLAEFDPSTQDAFPSSEQQVKIYNEFNSLPKELQEAYKKLRNAYARFSDEIISELDKEDLLGKGNKLLTSLLKKRIKPYFPLYRQGDYWLEFEQNGERYVESFKDEFTRNLAIKELKKNNINQYNSFTRVRGTLQTDASNLTGEFREILTAIKSKFGTEENQDYINSLYQMYLDLFPSNSIMQQFHKREGTRGFELDALGVFNQIHPRMAMNLAQFKSVKEIDEAAREAMSEIGETPQNPILGDIKNSLARRMGAFKNPTPSGALDTASAMAGQYAYTWFILGNISSAIVNLTQLPIVAYSLLGGKYGWSDALTAMKYATKLYFSGGKDNNTSFRLGNWNLTDYSAYGLKGRDKLPAEIRTLMEAAVQRGAIRRSLGQDIAEARTRSGTDATSKIAQTLYAGSWAFQNVERFNREVTLIAAFKLARQKGKDVNASIKEALDMTELSHGAAMSELGPELFQQNFGRVIGVFKRFALSQIYLIGKLMRDVYRGNKRGDKEVAKTAAKQLAGIYTMAFAFAGVKGLPMFGFINTILAAALSDEDDPFDLEEELMVNFGNIFVRGPLSALTRWDLSGRTGFGDLIYRPDDKLLADVGPLLYTLYQLGGAPVGAAQQFVDGIEEINQGRVERGIEMMLPSSIRNIMKSFRYASEDARTRQGYLLKETDLWDTVSQLMGFTPAEISEAYARNNMAKKAVRKAGEIKSRLYDRYYQAYRIGDIDGMREVSEDIQKFRESPLARLTGTEISTQNISRSVKNRRYREETAVNGITLPKQARNSLISRYGLDE